MKKKKFRIAAALAMACLAACTFALSACGEGGGAASQADISVWSASSAQKILRDYEYSDAEKGAAEVRVSLAQNESEGAQLILNTEEDISSYTVTVSDLTKGSDRIESENIKVYQQMYVETQRSSRDYFDRVKNITRGWFPDALLPFETAKAQRENKLYAGRNQGIWITFQTEASTPAGLYTGSVTIGAGGGSVSVPVYLEVWDFALDDTMHSRTLFNVYRDAFTDSIGDGSDEMYRTYYEFFLDYGINLQKLPLKADDLQAYVAVVKEYHNDPRVTTWALPTYNHQENKAPSGSTAPEGVSWRMEKQMELVVALAVESVKDGKNYLEKAVHYPIEHDEFSHKGSDAAEEAQEGFALFRSYTKKAAAQIDAVYGENFLDSVPGLRDSVEWLPQVAVSNYSSMTYEALHYANIWCPMINNVAPQTDAVYDDLFEDDTAQYGEVQKLKELWTYTCNYPQWPYPTYHIDDELFTSRLLNWMMYDYGYTGNLYYLAVMGGDSQSEDSGAYNPWEDAESNSVSNGDGNLVYPGTYYGIDGPVGTIRLESIRDGMEEYEYFYILENLYEEMADYYKAGSLSYRSVCNDIFASLYTDGHFSDSLTAQDVLDARQKVADAILSVKSDEHLIVEKEETKGNEYTVSILLSSAAEVEENEHLVKTENAGSGKRYTYTFDISGDGRVALDLTYTINGQTKTYTKIIKNATTLLAGMNTQADLEKVNVSSGSQKSLATLEGAPRVMLELAVTESGKQSWFNLLLDKLGSFEGDRLQIAVYNGGEDVTAQFVYMLTLYDSAPEEITLAHGWNRFDVDLAAYGVSAVEGISIRLDGTKEYTFYMGEVKFYES